MLKRRDSEDLWVARAGLPVWLLLAAAVALTGFVMVTEIAKQHGFFVDQFVLPVICGLISAAVLAVATSGVLLRGRTLVAVDVGTVHVVDANQVADVQDDAGLTIVTRNGRRIQPYVCGRTLAKQLNQNMRLRLAGDAIRAWQYDHLDDEVAAADPQRTPRWVVLLGVPAVGLACGLVTVALHAVF